MTLPGGRPGSLRAPNCGLGAVEQTGYVSGEQGAGYGL